VKPLTIAIDGYSSCGKSTLAKDIAHELNYVYVDSGAMYRAVTLHMMNKGLLKDGAFIEQQVVQELDQIEISFKADSPGKNAHTNLNGKDVEKEIRSTIISKNVSGISAVGAVREKLVELQQEMGQKGGVVMDGRDIGTVVFPKAEVKLFMTASIRIRAERRHQELIAKGENVSLEQVSKDLQRRDHLDMNRAISPLKKAEDAITVDNSHLSRTEQLEKALELIQDKINTLSKTTVS
jgi:cytidylate kinase